MNILNVGDTIMLSRMLFEEGQADIEKREHPGIVIVPTDEQDDFVYCIHMTSHKARYKTDPNEYYIINRMLRRSYINLKHIVKIPNEHITVMKSLNDKEYVYILKKLYEYQTENEETKEFKEIKERIDIILKYYDANKESEVPKIDSNYIKTMESIPQEHRELALSIMNEDPEQKQAMMVRSKIEDYMKGYRINDNNRYEKTRQFYYDLKIFNRRNLDVLLPVTLSVLRGLPEYNEYKDVIDDIKKQIEEIHLAEEQKAKRKQDKSKARNVRNQKKGFIKNRKKEKEKMKDFIKEYGDFDVDFK